MILLNLTKDEANALLVAIDMAKQEAFAVVRKRYESMAQPIRDALKEAPDAPKD